MFARGWPRSSGSAPYSGRFARSALARATTVGVMVIGATAGTLAVAGGVAAATPTTVACSGNFTVPPNVHSLAITADGASGGNGGAFNFLGVTINGGRGAAGGQVTGTLAVTPGQILSCGIGTPGAAGGGSSSPGTGGAGSAFGGGSGGNGNESAGSGGGGGGATEVSLAGTIVIVAGGGAGGAGGGIAGAGGGGGVGGQPPGNGISGSGAGSGGGGTGGAASTLAAENGGGAGTLTDAGGGGGGGGGYFNTFEGGKGGGAGGAGGGGGGGGGGGDSFYAASVTAGSYSTASVAPGVSVTYTPVAVVTGPVLSPTFANLGSAIAGQTGGSQVFTLTAKGEAVDTFNNALNTLSPSATNFGASSFTFTSLGCLYQAVGAGKTCTDTVQFTPAAGSSGLQVAQLEIETNKGNVNATLEGTSTPVGPISVLSPPSITTFSSAPGVTSATQTFNVSNSKSSTQDLVIGTFSGSADGQFGVTAAGVSNSCYTGEHLAPGAGCNFGATFTPKATDAPGSTVSGDSLTIGDNGANQELLSVSGTVTAPASAISNVGPAGVPALTFASPEGTASGVQYLTVTNNVNSTAPLDFPTAPVASITGTNPTRFIVDNASSPAGETPCVKGTVLDNNQSCTIGVVYIPVNGETVGNPDTATVVINDNGANPEKALVKGTPLAANQVTSGLSADTLTFGASPGATATAQTLTITNTTLVDQSLTIKSITGVSTPFAFVSAVGPKVCFPNEVLARGASCSVSISYSPTTAEQPGTTDNATLTVNDNGTNLEQVALVGNVGAINKPTSSLTPISGLSFTAPAGTTSKTLFATVTNDSTNGDALLFHNPAATTSGRFTFTNAGPDTCTAATTLAPGQSCVVGVQYTPGAAEAVGTPDTGTLTINDTGVNLEQISLNGTVVSTPAVTSALTPSSVNFGKVAAGNASKIVTVTVTNNSAKGAGLLVLDNAFEALTGPGAASFSIDNSGLTGKVCSPNESLVRGASCVTGVEYTPPATESPSSIDHATLDIADNGTNSPETAALTGTVAPSPTPTSSVRPGSLTFNQAPNTTSSVSYVTVTNVSTNGRHLFFPGGAGKLVGTNPADFGINQSSGSGGNAACGMATNLAPGQACSIGIQYVPGAQAPGTTNSAVLVVGDNGQFEQVALTGHVITAPAITSQLSPASLGFGTAVVVGTSSVVKEVKVTNNSASGNLVLDTPTFEAITGPDKSSFAIDNSGVATPCTAGETLIPGASCSTGVKFTPGASETPGNTDKATLDIYDNGAPATETASLIGTPAAPAKATSSVTPLALTFSAVPKGTDGPRFVTVTNVSAAGGPTLGFATPPGVISGAGKADFAVFTTSSYNGNPPCDSATKLAPGASCVVGVTYSPGNQAVGSVNHATLTISDNGANAETDIALTGTVAGITSVLSSTPSTCPDTSKGASSTCSAVTVANAASSTGNLTFGSPLTTSTNADFAPTGIGSCTSATSLAPGTSCTIVESFTPAKADAVPSTQNGTVTVNDNGAGPAETFAISGKVVAAPPPPPPPALSPSSCATGAQVVTGTVFSPVDVTTGSLCIYDATVESSVSFNSTGSLQVLNSTINDALGSAGASAVLVCNALVGGATTVANTVGPVTIGDGAKCAANTLDAGLSVTGGHGLVTLIGNTVVGSLDVTGNTDSAVGTDNVTIDNNQVDTNLSCSANTPGQTGSGNTVMGTLACPGVTKV